ncbi:MAG: hypothetical protein IJ729_04395, partial [Alloprevotella sp.]|nr:hypothetical protein [Alloprevotella sp.]
MNPACLLTVSAMRRNPARHPSAAIRAAHGTAQAGIRHKSTPAGAAGKGLLRGSCREAGQGCRQGGRGGGLWNG